MTPKEIKSHEYRVAVLPVGVEELIAAGHQVLVQSGAGTGSGLMDNEYQRLGAEMIATPDEVFARSDMVVKVESGTWSPAWIVMDTLVSGGHCCGDGRQQGTRIYRLGDVFLRTLA